MTHHISRSILTAVLVLGMGSAAWAAPAKAVPRAASVIAHPAALELASRIVKLQNNEGKAFAIVDKPHAAVSVFDATGQLLATTPVLLGLATGDDSVPGIGDRPMRLIKPHERTTPAGRFVSAAGRNTKNEDIVWVDYEAAVSMHRVRANVKADRRLERLASPGFDDNRISYGCINIPADFYDAWVKPHFSDKVGIVYVLPDQKSMGDVFDFAKPAL